MAGQSTSQGQLIPSSHVERMEEWQPLSMIGGEDSHHKPQHALYSHCHGMRMGSENEMDLELAVWRSKVLSNAFQEEVACIESLLAQGKL